jgi:hypothetical protein
MAVNVEDFVSKTQKLISKERDAEIAQTKYAASTTIAIIIL